MKKIKKTIIGLILGLFLSFSILLTNKIELKADTITDLTGYTWTGNNSVDLSDMESGIDYNLSFTSNNINYNSISFHYSSKDEYINYYTGINTTGTMRMAYSLTYSGWYSNAYQTIQITGGTDRTNSTLIAWFQNNGTLTAPAPTTYNLILNGNGAQFLIISSQTYENAISGTATAGSFYSEVESLLQLATISRTGYTLLGWNTDSSATTALSQAEINALSGNTTLYAIWNINSYTISFNANGGTGTPPASASVNYGGSYTIPGNTTNLTKTNYRFVGWNTDSSATTGLASLSNIQADITLYAIWAIDTYYLILNGNGAQFLIIQSQTYENAISGTATAGSFYSEIESLLQLATISRTGYTLLGWNTDSSATTALSQAEINALSGNTTLYAIWGRNCIVSFYANGATSGTTPANIEVLEGTTITLPGNPGGLARSGFSFVGWSRDPYATTTITTATIYNVDTRFYAIWQPINRYMNLTIIVNNDIVYTAEIFKETGNFYDLIFEVDDNNLLGIVFSNINYLRDSEADIEYVLMSYADRLVLSMLNNDVRTIGIYQSGYLVESGTIEQWQEYFTENSRFEMGFYDQGDITIEITTQDTGDLGRFKAIVASVVIAFQVLFDLRLGWFTIGGIISIVLTIGVVFFIFKVIKGGGN